MSNLTINGIDFNAELDYLGVYLKEMIDYLPFGVKIDISILKIPQTAEEIIRLYKQKGILFFSASESIFNPIEVIEPLTLKNGSNVMKILIELDIKGL